MLEAPPAPAPPGLSSTKVSAQPRGSSANLTAPVQPAVSVPVPSVHPHPDRLFGCQRRTTMTVKEQPAA